MGKNMMLCNSIWYKINRSLLFLWFRQTAMLIYILCDSGHALVSVVLWYVLCDDERTRLRNCLERSLHIKYWSQIIGNFLNNKSIVHLLIIINKSFFTDANMLETMHCYSNVNLYPMHTFLKLMHCIVKFYADANQWILPSLIHGDPNALGGLITDVGLLIIIKLLALLSKYMVLFEFGSIGRLDTALHMLCSEYCIEMF